MKLQFVGVNNAMDNVYHAKEYNLYVVRIEDAEPGEQEEIFYEALEDALASW